MTHDDLTRRSEGDGAVNMDSILGATIRKSPPQSQRECCRIAARQSIAAFGPAENSLIAATCLGLARGLFGEMWDAASYEQRDKWLALMEEEYRDAVAGPVGKKKAAR